MKASESGISIPSVDSLSDNQAQEVAADLASKYVNPTHVYTGRVSALLYRIAGLRREQISVDTMNVLPLAPIGGAGGKSVVDGNFFLTEKIRLESPKENPEVERLVTELTSFYYTGVMGDTIEWSSIRYFDPAVVEPTVGEVVLVNSTTVRSVLSTVDLWSTKVMYNVPFM